MAIEGEFTGPSYNEFRLFEDEEIKEEVSSIYVGTMKTFPISKFNERIYCVIKNDEFPNTQEFRTQILSDINIPRKEVNYLLFLWLVQKENLCNFILNFNQEE
jgi:hypothetical protein